MKNKLSTIGVIAVVLITGIVIFAFQKKTSFNAVNNEVYCSSDGVLTATMPIQSHRSYCVKSDASGKSYSAKTPSEYSFSIVNDQGNTLKDFAITHTKPMHVIVVRKDLMNFQHVHPEFDQAAGLFTLKGLTFPADGQYRIFMDFAPRDGQKTPMGTSLPVTISEDVTLGSEYVAESIGSEERAKIFDGYQVMLSVDQPLASGREINLTFDLKEGDKPITNLEEYLGALGHSVILKEGTLDFIHAHPLADLTKAQNGKVDFMVTFPEAGKYKIFTQFQKSGTVFTADFVVAVQTSDSQSMPKLDPMMH